MHEMASVYLGKSTVNEVDVPTTFLNMERQCGVELAEKLESDD